MKKKIVGFLLMLAVSLSAETIVIRQPGIVESLGSTAVGLVRGVTNLATGAVCGRTTVVNTTAPVVVSAPTYFVVNTPVVTTPVVTAPVVYQPVVTPIYRPLYYPYSYCYPHLRYPYWGWHHPWHHWHHW